MNGDTFTLVMMVLQIIWPFVLKSKMGPAMLKMTPLVNQVLSIITQVVAVVFPQTTPVALKTAGLLQHFGNTFLDILVNSLIQTLLVTGVHSAPKNTIQGVQMLKNGKQT